VGYFVDYSALRGAATLRQRTMKDTRHSVATVMPYERSNELRPSPSSDRCMTCHSNVAGYSGGDYNVDESEIDYSAHEILARGSEFLKRTRNGELPYAALFVIISHHHDQVLWRVVCFSPLNCLVAKI
jgi:hypothetical protein